MRRPRSSCCAIPFLFVLILSALQLHAQSVSAPDFSIVLLPDTQNEAQFFPQVLDSQTQWIADNRTRLNIRAVLGLGDIVNDGASPEQQGNADLAFKTLDAAGIPYFLAIGNHDYDGGEDAGVVARSVSGFNRWFGPSRYAGKSYYKGNFPSGSNENFYGVLTINGQQYLILVLEFIPRTESLDWAASVVKANPDKEVIVVTHSFIFVDNTTVDRCDTEDKPRADNDGEQTWEAFVSKYPNIIMAVSGHLTAGNGARHSELGVNGNLVNSMFSNYQELAHGGDGWLRLLTFHPDANTISVKTYSPYLNSYWIDDANQFTVYYHNPGFSTGKGKVTGRVTGSGCQKIAGATVSAGGASTTTDENGNFSLSVAPDSYTVEVSADGWLKGSRAVKVNDNWATDINFYLTKPAPCALSGPARAVTVCTPPNASTISSPVHLVAATSEPVMRMEVWVDGGKNGEFPGNVVDTNLTLADGDHDVRVTAVELDTSYFSRAVNFTVKPGSPPPPPPPPLPPPAPSDFALKTSPAALTVKHGDAAVFTLTFTPQNGAFSDDISLSCSGLPAGLSCNFSPATVNPGVSTVTSKLTISTPSTTAMAPIRLPASAVSLSMAALLPFAGFVMFGATRVSRRRLHIDAILLVLVAVIMIQGCGGGGSTIPPPPPQVGPPTPTGGASNPPTPTAAVTITGTSRTTTHSTIVSLTIQ